MRRAHVNSSNIAAIGYDRAAAVLEIEFKHGKVYRYEGVPDDLVARLFSAPSIGSFFNQHIAKRFEYQIVPG